MSTQSLSLRAQLLVSTAMIVLATHQLQAAPPRLDPPVVLPGGSVDLRLRGDSGSNYTVEASANLTYWFSLSNGVAINGLLTVRHEAGPNRPTFFYRGREAANTLPPLTVGPQLNTNLTVSTQSSVEVASGDTEYGVFITTFPDGSYTMFAFHIGFANRTSPVYSGEYHTEYERLSICDPPAVERDRSRTEPNEVLGQGTPAYQGTMTTTNTIAGTLSADDPQSTPPTTFKFDWRFKRVPQ